MAAAVARDAALADTRSHELTDAQALEAIPGPGTLVEQMPAGTWAVITSGSAEVARVRLLMADHLALQGWPSRLRTPRVPPRMAGRPTVPVKIFQV